MIIPTEQEQEFIDAYLEAIDFTELGDDEQPPRGAELDVDYARAAQIDCLAFYARIACYLDAKHITQAGYDFWLTRNGHGAGFWDRPELYGATYAQMFTQYSEAAGCSDAIYEQENQS